MTIAEQMQQVTDEVIRESLAALRHDADRQEWVNRVYRVPEDAVEAARLARLRLAYLWGDRPD